MERLGGDELKALYDASYASQLDSRDHIGRLGRLVGMANLDQSCDVVDFGCGNGALLDVLMPRVRSYTGVDFSSDFIELANARKERLSAPNASFECASIGEFCATHPAQFDVAFAFDFSEHVYDDDWIGILGQIRTSLKRTGLLYLHTPNAEFLLEVLKSRNILLKQSREHVAVRDMNSNVRLVERAGFYVRRAELISHYNALRFMHPLSYIPIVGRYLKARIFIEAGVEP